MIKSALRPPVADLGKDAGIGANDRAAACIAAAFPNCFLVPMRVLARLLEWIASNLTGTIALTSHVVLIHDDCPHCGERTLCEISAFHRHSRCLACGRSIREPDEPVEASRRVVDEELVAA